MLNRFAIWRRQPLRVARYMQIAPLSTCPRPRSGAAAGLCFVTEPVLPKADTVPQPSR
jgi:hypothetical protein